MMLELQNIDVVFAPHTPLATTALRGLSIAIEPQQIYVVIGANGAGKSTFLNVIAGDVMPTAGSIRHEGKDILRYPPHMRARHFARVLQDPLAGTCADLSIAENLSIAYRRGQSPKWRWALSQTKRQLFRSKLQEVGIGLEERLDEKVGSLSGGQRQILSV
ncbi:MAG: ATP-binding cassette domain-containing protein, partial [Alphaproteobacteria bacterium]|nr:ATP-binding cassette domain-containing protein [Alphaproteobacteria bacterium]